MKTIREFVRTIQNCGDSERARRHIDRNVQLYRDAPVATQYDLQRQLIETNRTDVARHLHESHQATNIRGYVEEWLKRWIRDGRSDLIDRVLGEDWILRHGPSKNERWARFYVECLKADRGVEAMEKLVEQSPKRLRVKRFKKYATQPTLSNQTLAPFDDSEGVKRALQAGVTVNRRALKKALASGDRAAIRAVAERLDGLYDDARPIAGRVATWTKRFIKADAFDVALDEGLIECGTAPVAQLLINNKRRCFRRAVEELSFNHRQYGRLLYQLMVADEVKQGDILPCLQPRRLKESRYVRGRILQAALNEHYFGTDNRGAIIERALQAGADLDDYAFTERDMASRINEDRLDAEERATDCSNAEVYELLVQYDVFTEDVLKAELDDGGLYEHWIDSTKPRMVRVLIRQGVRPDTNVEALIEQAADRFGSPYPDGVDNNWRDVLYDLIEFIGDNLRPDLFGVDDVLVGVERIYEHVRDSRANVDETKQLFRHCLGHLPKPSASSMYLLLIETAEKSDNAPEVFGELSEPFIQAGVVPTVDWLENLRSENEPLYRAFRKELPERRRRGLEQQIAT